MDTDTDQMRPLPARESLWNDLITIRCLCGKFITEENKTTTVCPACRRTWRIEVRLYVKEPDNA